MIRKIYCRRAGYSIAFRAGLLLQLRSSDIHKFKPQMNTDAHKSEIDRVSQKIIGCAFTVGNRLGCGFLEKVYENALVLELRKAGLRVSQQQLMKVTYDNIVVGSYVADVIVDGFILLEIKAVKCFDEVHTAQCLNYLKATELPLCLLINFGRPRVDIKRIILTKEFVPTEQNSASI